MKAGIASSSVCGGVYNEPGEKKVQRLLFSANWNLRGKDSPHIANPKTTEEGGHTLTQPSAHKFFFNHITWFLVKKTTEAVKHQS